MIELGSCILRVCSNWNTRFDIILNDQISRVIHGFRCARDRSLVIKRDDRKHDVLNDDQNGFNREIRISNFYFMAFVLMSFSKNENPIFKLQIPRKRKILLKSQFQLFF